MGEAYKWHNSSHYVFASYLTIKIVEVKATSSKEKLKEKRTESSSYNKFYFIWWIACAIWVVPLPSLPL